MKDIKKVITCIQGIGKTLDVQFDVVTTRVFKVFSYCDMVKNVSMCAADGNNVYVCIVEEGTKYTLGQIIKVGAVATMKASIAIMIVPGGINQILGVGGFTYGFDLLMNSSNLSKEATRYAFKNIHSYFNKEKIINSTINVKPKILSTEKQHNCIKMIVHAKNVKHAKHYAIKYFDTKYKNQNYRLDHMRNVLVESMVEDKQIVKQIRKNICKKNQQIKFLLNNITTIETSLPIDSSIEFYEENKTDYYVGEQRKYYLNEIFHQQIIEKPPPRANIGYSCSGGNGGGKGMEFLVFIPIITVPLSGGCCIS
jgi:hypothetical protein